MKKQFDLIVIGSGFGGAVTACRAAESGAHVLVLERGRRWSPGNYPRKLKDAWLYDHDRPEKKNGWLELRLFRKMAVAQGAGVGGGSLCYSSVVMEADEDIFDEGWPPEITFESLRQHYKTAKHMLGAREIPSAQVTARHQLLKTAATKIGQTDKFQSAPLAVAFDDEYTYDLPNPIDVQHTKAFRNDQGRWQGTCVHLGNCDIGCDVRAKNTLDVNYLAQAENFGAEIRPLHIVRCITPNDAGYVVDADRIVDRKIVRTKIEAAKVVVAAGSIGSTELLFRCRDELKTMPEISRFLGRNWSANGNFLTPAIYPDSDQVRQGIGPTISAALDYMGQPDSAHRFVIEDDGFPNIWLHALRGHYSTRMFSPIAWSLRRHLRRGIDEKNPLAHVMVWLGAGVDSGDGVLGLKRRWYAPLAQKKLKLSYSTEQNKKLIDCIIDVHRQLTQATGGKLYVPLFWRFLQSLITVHPLGGCKMGTSAIDGVVDHKCEVFGYPNLFVVDGATIPKPIGRNPSLTIAGIAERAASINFS